MDKVEKYKSIARQIAIETGKLGERPDDKVKTQLILDDERGTICSISMAGMGLNALTAAIYTLMSMKMERCGCNMTGLICVLPIS